MAAICNDGIIVGSDSRAVFFDNNGSVAAYYDESPKLFQYNDIVLAMSGQFSFNNTSFFGLFEDFKKETIREVDIGNFYNELLKFAENKLSGDDFYILQTNTIFICGYNKSIPVIYWYDKHCIDSIISGYRINLKNGNNLSFVNQFLKYADINKAISFIKVYIEDLASSEKDQNDINKIGGPTSIVWIQQKKTDWIYDFRTNKFKNSRELINAIRRKEVDLWYRSLNDSLMLMVGLKALTK